MYDSWLASFAADINQAQNGASVEAANGVGNTVGGSIGAVAEQTVGDVGFDYGDMFGDVFGGGPLVGDVNINVGVNAATVVAGNGAFNSIGGDVFAVADQHVGDADLPLLA